MKAKQIRKLTIEKLNEKIIALKKEIVEYNFNLKMGTEKDYARIKYMRRRLARMLTVLHERLSGQKKENVELSKSKKKNVKTKVGKTKKISKNKSLESVEKDKNNKNKVKSNSTAKESSAKSKKAKSK